MRFRMLLLLALLLVPLAVHAQEQTPSPEEAAAEQIVQMLVSGDYTDVYAQFNDTMKGLVTEDQLQQAWQNIVTNGGQFQKILITQEDTSTGTVTISLQFQNLVMDADVVLDSSGKIAGMRFRSAPTTSPTPTVAPVTPTYAQPATFTETNVTVGDYQLPGTLTMPKGTGPFPAVVLISGSGPNDRDETIGPNKPFRDIAWGLAALGIASVRYDKRTLVLGNENKLDIANLTVKEEYVDDSVAAVELLRKTSGIDPSKVFVLGHSLGGYVLPRIAQADKNIAGMIIASGLATPLPDAILRQVKYQLSLGTPPPNQDQIIALYQGFIDQINALTPSSPTTPLILGAAPAYWLDLKGYDPVALAASLPQPILVLQGERDYQVTMTDDFARWKSGLANHPDTTFKTYPDLNHIYVTGTGMSTPDEYQKPGNVAPEVINDIAAWIKAH